jgi:hypothetical protein
LIEIAQECKDNCASQELAIVKGKTLVSFFFEGTNRAVLILFVGYYTVVTRCQLELVDQS